MLARNAQHRINFCIKTKQHVHPRTLLVYVQEIMTAVIAYYRTVGNVWDALFVEHSMRDPDVSLERIFKMCFRTSCASLMCQRTKTSHPDCERGKVAKGKGKNGDGKGAAMTSWCSHLC